MKILHCCLAAFYIDNYSYQENILPKMHKLQGHEVAILASTETFVDNAELGYLKHSSYHTKDGIPITRLPYVKWLPNILVRKIRIYKGILKVLESFKPDIIFLHDCQFISIIEFVSYFEKNKNIKIYVDGHADFVKHGGRSSVVNWVSEKILHGIIYKWCAQKIEPFTKRFYGVHPLRVDFFKTVYGISENKVELLVMGVDDTIIDFTRKDEIRKTIREALNISESDFVIVTGAKIDHLKKIDVLMRALNELQVEDIKLIVFGSTNQQMKNEINELGKALNIRYIGWIPSEKVYDYFLAADLGFFPGTHSVLWEQAVGVGLPCVFKRWVGVQHVDVGGNCLFINTADIDEIKEYILLVYQNKDLLMDMRQAAQEKGVPAFSYYEIAKRSIEG